MLAEVGAAVCDDGGPGEKYPRKSFVFAAIGEAKENGDGEGVGGMGRGESVETALAGAEHAHVGQLIARPQSLDAVFKGIVADLVGKEEAEGHAEEDPHPVFAVGAEGYKDIDQQYDDEPAPGLAESPHCPIEHGAMVAVDPAEQRFVKEFNPVHAAFGIADR